MIKRIGLLLAMLLILTFAACAQNYVPSPQTVAWDPPAGPGDYTYEVAVIAEGADEGIPGNYTTVSIEQDLEELIDLEALSLFGEYIVTVRAIRDYHGSIEVGEWAYANRPPPDTDPAGGTFYIYRLDAVGKILHMRLR